MTKYLLQIHVGPVQSFIEAARRSRDLWFGSWWLSELSKAVAKAIADEEGIKTLIFPAVDLMTDLAPNSERNVANKIVAKVQNPKAVAAKAKESLDKRLRQFIDETFSPALRKRLKTWETAENQILDLPEYYWVSVSLKGSDYASARRLADNLLAARKNTRNFSPVTWGSNRPKSSLDGSRESVIPKDDSQDADVMYRFCRAKAGEQLSGVDLLKRLGKHDKTEHFPSTSHMAAIPLTTQLQEKGKKDVWDVYLATLPPVVLEQERIVHDLKLPLLEEADGSLLYESRLLDYFERSRYGRNNKLKLSQQALQNFYQKTTIDQPNLYYALLVGDGDFMGKTINALKRPKKHRAFSHTLADFANKVKQIVTKYQGAVIYAGGDDVLAFLPLHQAIQCASEMAKTFRKQMKDHKNEKGNSPTFSAGIAIIHHLEPLEDALNLARQAEKVAKEIPDKMKNALAVALDKRSGATRMVVGHWGYLDKRLLKLATLHQDEVIPDRLAYQLRDMYLSLGGGTVMESETALLTNSGMQPVITLEATRIIGRKRTADGKDEIRQADQRTIQETIESGEANIEVVANELIIAAEIAKACTLAGTNLRITTEKESGS